MASLLVLPSLTRRVMQAMVSGSPFVRARAMVWMALPVLAVAAAVEAVAGGVAARGGDRGDAGEAREACVASYAPVV